MENISFQNERSGLRSLKEKRVTTDPRQRAWIEVNSSAIEENAKKIKGLLADQCSLMAVVKADGYGHGSETVARAVIKGGANSLGVATLQEAIELRSAGLNCLILVLGNLTSYADLELCFDFQIMPTISSINEAYICNDIAQDSGQVFPVHLKFDTGMTRLGFDLDEGEQLIDLLDQLKYIKIKGIYSHLASAEDYFLESNSFTGSQVRKFLEIIQSYKFKKQSICFHLANSAGTLRDVRLHFDMVRVGLGIYGYSPIKDSFAELTLHPALSVKARVVFIREVPIGTGVSYGHLFITNRPSRLAVIGIGYADGISRALSGKISALFEGKLLPQVGAITMDQMVLDVTDQPSVKIGSVVTLLGSDSGVWISPQEWCDASGCILWEVLCGFKNRLPRIVIS